jgi:hypothetical protein
MCYPVFHYQAMLVRLVLRFLDPTVRSICQYSRYHRYTCPSLGDAFKVDAAARESDFSSACRRNTSTVFRKGTFSMQSSARMGRCPHKEHASGRALRPFISITWQSRLHEEQMDFSQHGSRKGPRASLLQIEHFRRAGMGPSSTSLITVSTFWAVRWPYLTPSSFMAGCQGYIRFHFPAADLQRRDNIFCG